MRNNMKIGLFTEWYLPQRGGVSSHVNGLYLELKRRGHDVKVFTKKNKMREKSMEGKTEDLVELSPALSLNLPILPPSGDEILNAISSYDLDIVHSHHAFTATPLVGLAYAEKLGIPKVLTNHSIPANYDSSFWEMVGNLAYPFKYYINKADEVIAVSKAAADFISFFVDYAPIRIIPNGVDASKFKPNYDKDNKEIKILFVSRLVFRKGPHILLRAFKKITKKYENVKLIYVGNGYMKSILEDLSFELGLADKVIFLGGIPDEELIKVYSNSDIFVLPSLHAESFGLVLLEAMASGLPVVASKVGGIPEVVENGKEGILVNPREEEIAGALTTLIENKSMREELGKNGRKKVEEKYDWKIVGEKIEEVYRELL